jgi:hypothetical protein
MGRESDYASLHLLGAPEHDPKLSLFCWGFNESNGGGLIIVIMIKEGNIPEERERYGDFNIWVLRLKNMILTYPTKSISNSSVQLM